MGATHLTGSPAEGNDLLQAFCAPEGAQYLQVHISTSPLDPFPFPRPQMTEMGSLSTFQPLRFPLLKFPWANWAPRLATVCIMGKGG